MSVRTIQQFGGVIRTINKVTEDPQVRFWAFLEYVSTHPAGLLSAEPPAELTDQVHAVLKQVSLPLVEVEPGREPSEPAKGRTPTVVELPPSLYREYCRKHPFDYAAEVNVLLQSGAVLRPCVLMDEKGIGTVVVRRGGEGVNSSDVVAIRAAPGCLGWFRRRKWVRETSHNSDGG